MALVALCLATAALLAAGDVRAGRFAIGVERGASLDRLERRLERMTGGRVTRNLAAVGALTLSAPAAKGAERLPGVRYVERIDRVRRLAFSPPDPLAARQWYLGQTRAFDAWPELPALGGVRVAIVDSGIDYGHPEFAGRIAETKTFVGGDPRKDELGHGTFVAGIIAANLGNGQGIAGIAFPSQLLIAKVVRGGDRTIPVEAEAEAIRWAVDKGAQVINLSLGGLRDPRNPKRDTYSQLEADAVAYAYRRGAVLVAAVGNTEGTPRKPWPFASYPAALPHVIGVSALARDGSIPSFSHQDKIFNDISAPGQEIFSTLPRALTAQRPECVHQGYSECGPDEYRLAEGTSFAAPQVAAAAALVRSVRPDLQPGQVMHVLTRTAVDTSPLVGRDAYAGWGRLDITNAVQRARDAKPPSPDSRETNDDAGSQAATLWGRRGGTVRATIDFWDDQTDVYRVRLRKGQRLFASLRGPPGTDLFLWKPGTKRVDAISEVLQHHRVAQSAQRGSVERFAYRAPRRADGFYYLQVKISEVGDGPYTLSVTK